MKPLSVLLIGSVLLSRAAQADLILSEPFDYSAFALDGVAGGTGWGANEWVGSVNGGVRLSAVPGSLAYPDGVSLSASGNRLNSPVNTSSVRLMGEAVTLNNTYYLSFLARRAEAGSFRIETFNASNQIRFGTGVGGDGSVYAQSRLVQSASAPDAFPPERTYLILAKTTSSTTSVAMYETGVDTVPPDEAGVTWLATAAGNVNEVQDRVRIAVNRAEIDEIRFGTTYQSVTEWRFQFHVDGLGEDGRMTLIWPDQEGKTWTVWSATSLFDAFKPEAANLWSAGYTGATGDAARFFRVSAHDAFSGAMVRDDFSGGQGSWAARGAEESIRFEDGAMDMTPTGARSAAAYHVFDPIALRDGETLRLTVDVSTDRADPRAGDIRVGLGFAHPPILSAAEQAVPLAGYYLRIPSGGDTRDIPVMWKPETMEPDYFFDDSGTVSLGQLGNTRTVGSVPVELVFEITRSGEELIFSGRLDGAVQTTTATATGDQVIDRFLFNTVGLAYRHSSDHTVTYDNVRVELSGKQFPVDEFYRSSDGTDAGPSIRRAVAAAQTFTERNEGLRAHVWFTPDAVYRLERRTDARPQIELYEAERVSLIGNHALLATHINNNHFSLWRSRDIEIEGFRLDMDPLPFTQGTVVGLNRAEGTFDLHIDPGFAAPPLGLYLSGSGADDASFHDADGIHMRQNWVRVHQVVQVDGLPADTYRVVVDAQWAHNLDGVSVGNRCAIKTITDYPYGANLTKTTADGELVSNGGGNIELRKSEHITIRNVDSHASRAQTVNAQGCGDLLFDQFRFLPKPGTPRLLGSNKGGLIMRNNIGVMTITNCWFESANDDLAACSDTPLDWVGAGQNIIEVTDDRYAMEQADGWSLLIVDPQTPLYKGRCRIASVQKLNGTAFRLALDQFVFEPGHWNLDVTDALFVDRPPVVIRDTVFRNGMKKGIISRGPLDISGCAFRDLNFGIHQYYEGGGSGGPFAQGLIASGNTFTDIFNGGIVCWMPPGGAFNVDQAIVISGNLFDQGIAGHGVSLTRMNGVEVTGNVFLFDPSVPGQWRAIQISNSQSVVLSGNTGDRLD